MGPRKPLLFVNYLPPDSELLEEPLIGLIITIRLAIKRERMKEYTQIQFWSILFYYIMSVPTGGLTEWFADQYLQSVDVRNTDGGNRYRQLISQFPVKNPKYGFQSTGRERMSKFMSLKMNNMLANSSYNCAVISVSITVKKDTTTDEVSGHYAIVYWPVGTSPVGTVPVGASPAEGAEYAYITVSPTFESRDGEYRRRMIPLTSFLKHCEEYADALAPFEEAVLDMVNDSRLDFHTETFGIDAIFPQSRIPILALSVALMLDLWDNKKTLIAVHVQKYYTELISTIAASHPSLLTLSKTFDRDAKWPFVSNSKEPQAAKCGVKMVPMYTREVNLPFDMNLGAWRELEVTKAVGDLVISYVSPAFSFFNQWTYIEKIRPALFENAAMRERFARGAAMRESVKALRESRCALSGDCATDFPVLGPEQRTYHTEELSAQLYESLEYAQSHLLMSDVALVQTGEDVGRTLYSWPIWARRDPVVPPSCLRVLGDDASFARLLFDYVYGAHCLHERLGVVHGDLHANNLTVYKWGAAETENIDANGKISYETRYENPVMMYITGPRGEADSYVFPADGISGCLIDYSRAILGPAFHPRLEAGRGPQFATNFYRDQVNRVMRLLHRHAPDYVKAHQDAIKGAAYADFGSVFAALCAVDFIAIGVSAGSIVESAAAIDPDEIRCNPVAPGAAALARALERAGREALLRALHSIVARTSRAHGGAEDLSLFASFVEDKAPCLFECPTGECGCVEFTLKYPALASAAVADAQLKEGGAVSREPAGSREPSVSPPGLGIIKKLFTTYEFGAWARTPGAKDAQLVDAYNYNNRLASSSEYSAWPSWAQLGEIEKHLGDLKMTDLFARGTDLFLAALTGRDAGFEALAAQSRADAEKEDGKPVAAASSWIDD